MGRRFQALPPPTGVMSLHWQPKQGSGCLKVEALR